MKIKIIVDPHEIALPDHLTDLGITPGTVIENAQPYPNSRLDALQFWAIPDDIDDEPQLCTILPKNYKKI